LDTEAARHWIERYRHRLRVRRAATAAAWALAGGAGLALAGAAGVRAGVLAGPVPGAAAVAFGLCLGAALLAPRVADAAAAARALDRRLGLGERLATAREIAGRTDPVARALVADAEARAAAIGPEALPGRVARGARLGAAVAGAALAGLAALALVPAGVGEGPAAEAAAVPATATVEDVMLMAELVASAAVLRDEDTLSAVAAELRTLAREAGRGLGQRELEERLGALVEAAAVGFDRDPPDWLPADRHDLAALGAGMAAHKARLQAAQALNAEVAARNREFLQAFWDEQQAEEAALAALEPVPSFPLDGPGPGPGDAGAGVPPPGAAPPGAAGMAGAPAGAAEASGLGEGEAAGGGAQPLGRDEGYLRRVAGRTEAVSLAAAEHRDGNRIRMEGAPMAGPPVASAPGAGAVAGGAPTIAAAGPHVMHPPAARAVIARYFRPSDGSGDAP
jgi:hypothetical protein